MTTAIDNVKKVLSGGMRIGWYMALDQDGYQGKIGLETHLFDGTLITAAHTSMEEIMHIVSEI